MTLRSCAPTLKGAETLAFANLHGTDFLVPRCPLIVPASSYAIKSCMLSANGS